MFYKIYNAIQQWAETQARVNGNKANVLAQLWLQDTRHLYTNVRKAGYNVRHHAQGTSVTVTRHIHTV